MNPSSTAPAIAIGLDRKARHYQARGRADRGMTAAVPGCGSLIV